MELAFNYETNACGILHYISIQYLFKSRERLNSLLKTLLLHEMERNRKVTKQTFFEKKILSTNITDNCTVIKKW